MLIQTKEGRKICAIGDSFPGQGRSSQPIWICVAFLAERSLDILSAIKREERKLEKRVASIQHKLKGIKAAAEAMGRSADKKVTKSTKRVLSAAARAKMGKATKKRWAKFRAEAKKLTR